MSKEQLGELAEALTVLSAKSSIVKEREELKALMQDNIKSEQVRFTVLPSPLIPVAMRMTTDQSFPSSLSSCRNRSSTPRTTTRSRRRCPSESGP